jgi:hypothetical protein
MRTAFQDYYRCPDPYGVFTAAAGLSSSEGYFAFAGATCFGRCHGVTPSSAPGYSLPVLADTAVCHDGRVELPFELSEVLDNLREERYTQKAHYQAETFRAANLVRAAYYFIRPILPVSVRKHLQRAHLSGWDRIPFPRWPVDMSVEILMQQAMALELKADRVESMPFIWFWPDGANGCAILTHDVESDAGLDFCQPLMDLDDEYGIKASFQLVPERRYATPESLLESIRTRGFEVNVHDLNHDGRLFQNRELFKKRVARINAYGRQYRSRGFRAAAMYRDERWFNDLEFSYDLSVPNVAHLEPQRGGCCTVMPYFIGNLVELPLTTIQDYSLFNILGDYSIAIWKKQIDMILAQHGLVTLLSHPDYLIDPRARGVYSDLLAHVAGLRDRGDIWMALPKDVADWWRSRHSMTLVRAADGWRVEGEGSERARVAYATLAGDHLQYHVVDQVVQAV